MADIYTPRLRVLIDPIYIQASNLTSSSTYHRFVAITRELVKRGHFVYWMIPDSEYVPDDIESSNQVGVIRTSYVQDQFVLDGLVTDEFFNLFNRVAGKYQIDVVLTVRTGLALYYKRILEPPRFHDTEGDYTDKGYGLPVVISEGFPQTRKRHHTSRAYWLMQCQGYLGADATIFLSEHNKGEVVVEMMDWFKTSVVQKWDKTTVIVPTGIPVKELDTYYEADRYKSEKGFNVLSLGRLMGNGYIEYLPWFDYLYKSGIDCTLTLSLSGSLSGPMKSKLKKTGFDMDNLGKHFIVKTRNPRKIFLRQIKKYHCAIVPVSHYDHPGGILEAIYLGLPVIIPVSDYQKSFFPDYPFVTLPRDKAGLLAMILWIRDNQEEARKMLSVWRDLIRVKYDNVKTVETICNILEVNARKYINKFKTSRGVIDILRELKGEAYTWDDVVTYLRKSGWMGVSIGNMKVRTTFTYCASAIHHAMRYVGYVDTCEGPNAYFVRKDVFERELTVKDNQSSVNKIIS